MPHKFSITNMGSVDSVVTLLKSIDKIDLPNNERLLYRGHENAKFTLSSSISRSIQIADKKKILVEDEMDILDRFARRAFNHVGPTPSLGHLLFIARHYGLPTRLVDWTSNLLTAVYFSCSGEYDCDGNLWALKRRRYLGKSKPFWSGSDLLNITTRSDLEQRFAGNYVRIIDPVHNSERITSQDGYFTIQGDLSRSLEALCGESFKKGELDICDLYCWVLPKEQKGKILRELSQMGISNRSVYPDLTGIAKSIVEAEVLWRS